MHEFRQVDIVLWSRYSLAVTIQMDRTVPFVDAVYRVMEDNAPLQAAVDALVQAEYDCGIMLLGSPMDLDDDEWRQRLQASSSNSQLRARLVSAVPPPRGQDGTYGRFYGEGGSVWKYLDSTHLVLNGEDMCNHVRGFIFDADNFLADTGSWRFWGSVVADWVASRWKDVPWEPGTSLTYMAFYMPHRIDSYVHRYQDWCRVAVQATILKNRQLLEREGLGHLI